MTRPNVYIINSKLKGVAKTDKTYSYTPSNKYIAVPLMPGTIDVAASTLPKNIT